MKIILSRKGFDSSYGGYPSIVLPNGGLVSLPIPLSDDKRRYSELACENSDLLGLMNQLGIKKFDSHSTCHLDPDINEDFIRRPRGWKGAFGQVGAAQSHLENKNHKVKIGDLFLFFGWFRKTIKDGQGQYKYSGPDFHLIYGYLQIGKILKVNANRKLPQWLKDHPHANHEKYLHLQGGHNNTIYLSSDELTFLNGVPGYGCFRYNPKLVLTKPGETRTHWDLPRELKNVKITYHTDRSWQNGYFQSAHRGQEFVFDEASVVEDWGKDIIRAGLCEPLRDENGNIVVKKLKKGKVKEKTAMVPTKLFHDFRRTAIRNMVRAGVPERVAMENSGHKTRSVFERYNIVSDQDLKEAARKSQAYYEKQSENVEIQEVKRGEVIPFNKGTQNE